jgi:hypothetical protein
MYIYDSTMNRVPASGQIGVNDLASSSTACGPAGSAARRACFDFALASGYGLGTIPSFRSATLWHPGDPDAAALQATIAKWVNFFKTHRDLFTRGHMLHIARPDSRHVEATAYVCHNGTERGMLTLFNPTNGTQNVSTALPLYYAGFKPGDKVSVARLPTSSNSTLLAANRGGMFQGNETSAQTDTHVVGSEGGAAYDIIVQSSLPPRSYVIFSVN